VKSEDSPVVKVVKAMVQQIMKKSSAITPNYLIDNGMMAEDFAQPRVTNAISHANTIVLVSILTSCEPGSKHLLSPLSLICHISLRDLRL